MTDFKANEKFYEWETEKYGDDSPLSDKDRELWVSGFIEGVYHLFGNIIKHEQGKK